MKKIQLVKGDITSLEVDVIVNAANNSLMGGSGVDGAIHRVGGPQILEECMAIRKRQGGCPTGEAVITTGGNLKTKFVIHTVGPVWSGNNPEEEEELLSNAYRNSLLLAVSNQVRTIAFPNISTGTYRFPKRRAAEIAIREVTAFVTKDESLQVTFCCFDQQNFDIYSELLVD